MTLIKRVHISEEITLILRKAKLANLTLILRVNVSREDGPTKNTGHQSRWPWIYNDWPKDMTPTAYTPGPKGMTVTSWVDGPRDTTLIQRVDGPKDMTPGLQQKQSEPKMWPLYQGSMDPMTWLLFARQTDPYTKGASRGGNTKQHNRLLTSRKRMRKMREKVIKQTRRRIEQ